MNLEIHFYPIMGISFGIDYFDNNHDENRDWDVKTICLQLFVVGINFNFYEQKTETKNRQAKKIQL